MGSRKKKTRTPSEKQKFFTWYRSLSILDRIAYKAYLFNFSRSRIALQDLFNYPYFWQIGPRKRALMIEEGYCIEWPSRRFSQPYYKL